MAPFERTRYYRTSFEDYAEKWSEYFAMRLDDGVLEFRLHSDGGAAKWGFAIHRALVPALADVWADPEVECVIVTGTGDAFLNEADDDDWERFGFTESFTFKQGYEYWYRDHMHEPFALLNLDVPVITALNGPISLHPELAFLADLVLCTPETTVTDGHFTGVGIVPGDGVQIIFRELLGRVRANHFLLTGETLGADQMLAAGLVGEVVPADELLDRAWDLARNVFMKVDGAHRRLTRSLLVQPWRELLTKELPLGMAMECWATQTHWPLIEGDGESSVGS
jgi:enoyl-CoA hydratase/carnithine racemase